MNHLAKQLRLLPLDENDSDAWSTANEAADRIEQLERELAECRKDAERMNWLESDAGGHAFCHVSYGDYRYYAHQLKDYPTVRQVIDEAMTEQQHDE